MSANYIITLINCTAFLIYIQLYMYCIYIFHTSNKYTVDLIDYFSIMPMFRGASWMARSYLNDVFSESSKVTFPVLVTWNLRLVLVSIYQTDIPFFYCWQITLISICKTNPNPKSNPKTDPNPKKTLTLEKKGKMSFWKMELFLLLKKIIPSEISSSNS